MDERLTGYLQDVGLHHADQAAWLATIYACPTQEVGELKAWALAVEGLKGHPDKQAQGPWPQHARPDWKFDGKRILEARGRLPAMVGAEWWRERHARAGAAAATAAAAAAAEAQQAAEHQRQRLAIEKIIQKVSERQQNGLLSDGNNSRLSFLRHEGIPYLVLAMPGQVRGQLHARCLAYGRDS